MRCSTSTVISEASAVGLSITPSGTAPEPITEGTANSLVSRRMNKSQQTLERGHPWSVPNSRDVWERATLTEGLRGRPFRAARRTPTFLFGPAESLQVEPVPVVELDPFLFQQLLLEGVAAMAGEGAGHLARRVDHAMPGNIRCRVEVLENVANKAGAPWQAGHCGDLAIGSNPAPGNAADYSANRRGGFVASAWGGPEQLAYRLHRQLSVDSRDQADTLSVASLRRGVIAQPFRKALPRP